MIKNVFRFWDNRCQSLIFWKLIALNTHSIFHHSFLLVFSFLLNRVINFLRLSQNPEQIRNKSRWIYYVGIKVMFSKRCRSYFNLLKPPSRKKITFTIIKNIGAQKTTLSKVATSEFANSYGWYQISEALNYGNYHKRKRRRAGE